MEIHSRTTISSLHFLVTVLIFGCSTKPCYGAGVTTFKPTSTEFIRTSCSTTRYPSLCFSSLSAYASRIQNCPVQLARTALSVSLASARSTSTMLARMKAGEHMRPREAAAMSDCMETIGNSVAELRESLGEMRHLGGKNVGFQINSIQTWVSAALTNDDTCMDGFASSAMNGEVKNAVRAHVTKVAHLTSNALAFINALAPTS